MSTVSEGYDACQFCSVVSKSNGEDPIGSAATHTRYLIMEVALPWERTVTASRHVPQALPGLLRRAGERGEPVRFQAVAPDRAYTPEDHTRVILLGKPSGMFADYTRDEFVVPTNEAIDLVGALVEDPSALPRFERFRQDRTGVRDLLVCTHGTHDACCATLGFPTYATLRHEYTNASQDELRVWRTSHIGGHRFAPTLIDVPTMRYWGHLEPDLLEPLVTRTGPVSRLRRCYRGWGGVERPVQVAEREIFIREGWAWSDYLKHGWVVAANTDTTRWDVCLAFQRPDGMTSGHYAATVEVNGSVLTLPHSGAAELTEALQYRVHHLDLVGSDLVTTH